MTRRREAQTPTLIKIDTKADLTARAQLRQWARDQLIGRQSVSIPALRLEARQHFSADPAFLAQLLDELLDAALYSVVQQVVAWTRTLTVLGDEVVTKSELEAHVKQKRSQWVNWLEHVNGKHIKLIDMTREELLAAAAEREQRAGREMELATLWRTLADKLEGGERLGERFSAVEIEAERIRLAKQRMGESA